MDTELLFQGIVMCLIMFISVIIHEWSHAYVADRLGDNTPRSEGRVTLNPAPHIDILGTIIIPVVFFIGPAFGFSLGFMMLGWGKFVTVDPRSFKNPVRDHLLSMGAGPASNLAIGLIAAVIGGIVVRILGPDTETAQNFIKLAGNIIQINIILAIFHMLPIPPLDGSYFLKYLTNMSDEMYESLSRWGFVIMLVFIFSPFIRIIHTLSSILLIPYQNILIFLIG